MSLVGQVVAIPGARTVAELEEKVAAADLGLSAAELNGLTTEAARFELVLRR